MSLIITALIMGLIYSEIRFVRAYRPELVRKAFDLPRWMPGLYFTLICAVFAFGRRPEHLVAMFFIIIFPVFLYRHMWLRAEAARPQDGEAADIALTDNNGLADRRVCLLFGIDGFGVVYYWFCGVLLLQASVEGGVALIGSPGRLLEMVLLAAGSLTVMLVLIVRMVRSYPQLNLLDVLGLSRKGLPAWKAFGLPVLTGMVFALVSSTILFFRKTQPATPLGDVISTTQSETLLLLFLAMAVLAAPFLEEIIFRGFFFYLIKTLRGTVAAVVVISAVFAGLHVHQYWTDWAAILAVAALGVVLTLFRAVGGSSLPGIVMHYTYNGLMTVLPAIFLMMFNPSYFAYQRDYSSLTFQAKEGLLLNSIETRPEFVPAYNDLAWLYAEESYDLNEALRLIDVALKAQPGAYAYLDTRAEILYRMGRSDEAIALMEDLIARYPDDKYLQGQLEKFNEGKGKREKGKDADDQAG